MVTTGVLGQRWRATVTPWGAIEPWSGGEAVDWHVAATDRWHSPNREPSVRQRRVEGTAVVETRLRVPDGDVVHTVYSVADHGGLTLIAVRNESPSPVVVAFTRGDLLTIRPPSNAIEGIDLPAGSVAIPIGHHAEIVVGLAHPPRVGELPSPLPSATGVARGWTSILDRASRFSVPDVGETDAIAAVRCELALCGPVLPDDDAVDFLLGVGQLVRMGETADDWVPDVAVAAEKVLRAGTGSAAIDWASSAALDAAAIVLAAAGERRAGADLERGRAALASTSPLPDAEPASSIRRLEWFERRFASGGMLMPAGMPDAWRGSSVECYGVPTGPTSSVSFAIRWHGERPAVLWEQTGDIVTLRSPVLAPQWSSSAKSGEALWPAPSAPG